ncbi:MAG: SUMF1/EgtB/PvdO family nonheme iron enzyme [Bacteroidales bacterium]|nr:SUMF1/EgtB/PvdO family nonheme iron enzyme [Bacteroidales bacterium]
MKKTYTVLIVLLCMMQMILAQNPCATALKNAQTDYNNGKYSSALQKIENAETNLKCKDARLGELKQKCLTEINFSNNKSSADSKFSAQNYGEALNLYRKLLASSSKQKNTKDIEKRIQECEEKIAEMGYMTIERIEFANLNSSSNVLSDYGSPIYSDAARLLKPRIVCRGCDDQRHAVKISYKIIGPDGKLFSDPLFSPTGYTFAVNVVVEPWETGIQKINLEAWGSPVLSIYSPGDYVCEIWYEDHLIFSQSFSMEITPFGNRQYTANGVAFNMVAIRGSQFKMGGKYGNRKIVPHNEKNEHMVRLSDYYIGESEVTQALWHAVMRTNNSYHLGDSLPVSNVSWYDAVEFCNRLSELTGHTPYYVIVDNQRDPNNKNREDEVACAVYANPRSDGFRLPTEAEWEYAARGGEKGRGYQYSGTNDPAGEWWNLRTSKGDPHPVADSRPNELGIFDMSGSMSEWCYDWFGPYNANSVENPTGAVSGKYRVLRGGSWFGLPRQGRVSRRSSSNADSYGEQVGFRISKNR